MSTDYKKKVIELIAEKAGMDPEEIDIEAFFEDDLNIGHLELIDILEGLEEIFHIELMVYKDDLETVQDLLDQVAEQVE